MTKTRYLQRQKSKRYSAVAKTELESSRSERRMLQPPPLLVSRVQRSLEVSRFGTALRVAVVRTQLVRCSRQRPKGLPRTLPAPLAAPRLAWALIAEPVEPEVDAARLRYRAAYADLYKRVLDDGVARGELPPQSTALGAAALVGAIAEALVGPLSAPLADAGLPDQLTAFVLRAVGARPGGAG